MSAEQVSSRERRIRQFDHYVELMQHRTLDLEKKADSFLVFSVKAPPEVRPRIGGAENRIVQFAFTENGFYLDLPDTTLTLDEAKLAVAERPGFGFALNKSKKRLGERQFDPVQRQYQYAQHRIAAEDAAYVFFDLWKAPLDAYIMVSAATFETSHRWETDFSLG